MTWLYYDPVVLQHDTGAHPEQPERLRRIINELENRGLVSQCRRKAWRPASEQDLLRVHGREYLDLLRNTASRIPPGANEYIESDTVMCGRSWEIAQVVAGAAVDAVQQVVAASNEPASAAQKRALCLVRPPGHHALADAPMGFCLLGNVAVAARLATQALGIDRVLIVDWDVHHGNGTQAIFWEDERVGFFSIHRHPFYPGTGDRDETGSGRGLGLTHNVPVSFGTSRHDYLARLNNELTRFADKVRPQLVLVSAGFDAHAKDPVGNLGLEVEDFGTLTKLMVQIANTHADGKLVSVLEGGYNPPVLADCVALHLEELLAAEE